MPARIEPCVAMLVDKPPKGPQWIFEVKWDGYRLAVHVEPGRVRVITRGGYDWTRRFAVIAAEVKSREQAEKMKGQKLFVPRANLPATADDEYYVVDLLGSRAEALDGTVLGDIVAVWNFGAGDIIEYRPPNGGPNVRVTFTKETAPLVDLPGKRVVLDPPAPEPLGK